MPRQSVLAGQIAPVVESFVLSKDDLSAIIEHAGSILSGIDLVVLFGLGWLLVPYTRTVYAFTHRSSHKDEDSGEQDDYDDEEESDGEKDEFKRTYLYYVAEHISQIARLASLVYACDILVAALEAVGYKTEDATKVFAKILYSIWVARRIQGFKRYLIRKALNRAPENCDKIQLLNRVLDGIIYALLLVKILDYLSVHTDMALGSIFAVGTTGGLIVSLASQEIAKGVMNGVEMAASDRFYEGDNVHFGDGTQGYIVKMGFLSTTVRKYDSSVVTIPNTQLGGQRVINITRSKTCRVITVLRFDYADVPHLPETMKAVKEEIATACPKLIKKGKPFRAMISGFERGHVEATINCSFTLPPTGEEFWANREQMFLAIDRGVRRSGVNHAKNDLKSSLQFLDHLH